MAVDMKRFELDRVLNMLRAFNWEMVTSSIEGDEVKLTIKKLVRVEAPKAP